MESLRQKKVAKLIQKEVISFFQTQGNGFFKKTLATVTWASMSPDLSIARVYLSFLPSDQKDEHLKKVSDNMGMIRGYVGNKLRSSLRIIPELVFFHDDTAEHSSNINSILDALNIPPTDDPSTN